MKEICGNTIFVCVFQLEQRMMKVGNFINELDAHLFQITTEKL